MNGKTPLHRTAALLRCTASHRDFFATSDLLLLILTGRGIDPAVFFTLP